MCNSDLQDLAMRVAIFVYVQPERRHGQLPWRRQPLQPSPPCQHSGNERSQRLRHECVAMCNVYSPLTSVSPLCQHMFMWMPALLQAYAAHHASAPEPEAEGQAGAAHGTDSIAASAADAAVSPQPNEQQPEAQPAQPAARTQAVYEPPEWSGIPDG
jgi:hypothetical protein